MSDNDRVSALAEPLDQALARLREETEATDHIIAHLREEAEGTDRILAQLREETAALRRSAAAAQSRAVELERDLDGAREECREAGKLAMISARRLSEIESSVVWKAALAVCRGLARVTALAGRRAPRRQRGA